MPRRFRTFGEYIEPEAGMPIQGGRRYSGLRRPEHDEVGGNGELE